MVSRTFMDGFGILAYLTAFEYKQVCFIICTESKMNRRPTYCYLCETVQKQLTAQNIEFRKLLFLKHSTSDMSRLCLTSKNPDETKHVG